MRREDDWWLNLNGVWESEIDRAASGEARGYASGRGLSGEILVPFCPESRLSGIEDRDFLNSVWYRRLIDVPERWQGRRVLLHVGACDYRSTVWLNGHRMGDHEGGYTPFSVDLTDRLCGDGSDELVIRAVDPIRTESIPAGKQSRSYASHGCYYARTTGIWQTVWLEAVPEVWVENVHVTPNLQGRSFIVGARVAGSGSFLCRVTARADGETVGAAEFEGHGPCYRFADLRLQEARAWSPRDPFLYGVEVELDGPSGRDRVTTYAGLRSFETAGKEFRLNGETIFLRTVLDQGFYPDGIYTAPSVADLEGDIDASMAFGFNGARLHEKVFEPAFLHLCDRKGYLVFGEYADWAHGFDSPGYCHALTRQWLEALDRDRSHPSIVGWCPLNESRSAETGAYGEWTTRQLYEQTRAADPSRPVIDASGYFHYETDIWDCHTYQQDVETFRRGFDLLAQGGGENPFTNCENQLPYDGRRPYFVSEFGGIGWEEGAPEGWGYGKNPRSREEFMARFRGLVAALLGNPGVAGFCYTQLTDVEQERNGLMTYDRRPKFDPGEIAAIIRQKAAIER